MQKVPCVCIYIYTYIYIYILWIHPPPNTRFFSSCQPSAQKGGIYHAKPFVCSKKHQLKMLVFGVGGTCNTQTFSGSKQTSCFSPSLFEGPKKVQGVIFRVPWGQPRILQWPGFLFQDALEKQSVFQVKADPFFCSGSTSYPGWLAAPKPRGLL